SASLSPSLLAKGLSTARVKFATGVPLGKNLSSTSLVNRPINTTLFSMVILLRGGRSPLSQVFGQASCYVLVISRSAGFKLLGECGSVRFAFHAVLPFALLFQGRDKLLDLLFFRQVNA